MGRPSAMSHYAVQGSMYAQPVCGRDQELLAVSMRAAGMLVSAQRKLKQLTKHQHELVPLLLPAGEQLQQQL